MLHILLINLRLQLEKIENYKDANNSEILKILCHKIAEAIRIEEIFEYLKREEKIMCGELRYGRIKFFSFLIIDLVCLFFANIFALWLYVGRNNIPYTFVDHYSVVILMMIIDIVVTFFFSSLRRVLRWRTRREIYESARHVFYCFIILGLYLFITKNGADYSRITVVMAYSFDLVFIFSFRTGWRHLLNKVSKKKKKPKALLMTTDRFVNEGISELRKLNYDVSHLYLLKNFDKDQIDGISVAKDAKEAASIICWEMIDKVYVYGLDHQMVPEYLINACKEMNLSFELVDFNYRVIELKTIQNEDPKYGALSFLEGERDIPFPIRRVYWITETEADLHRGFHAHKLNCQLLYCPYGKIDIILDDGKEKNTVTLDKPGKGLILMPGLWREMVWKESGSVLCVLASEYYDEHEYIRNYDEFIAYSRDYREGAVKQ